MLLTKHINSFLTFNSKIFSSSRISKTFKTRYFMSKSNENHLNVVSWNINGIRALYKHDKEATVIPKLCKKYSSIIGKII